MNATTSRVLFGAALGLVLIVAPRPAPAHLESFAVKGRGNVETLGVKSRIGAAGTTTFDEDAGTMSFTATFDLGAGATQEFSGSGTGVITSRGRLHALLDVTGGSGRAILEGSTNKNHTKFAATLSIAVPGATPAEFSFAKLKLRGTLEDEE